MIVILKVWLVFRKRKRGRVCGAGFEKLYINCLLVVAQIRYSRWYDVVVIAIINVRIIR